jgi:hypothetical protein
VCPCCDIAVFDMHDHAVAAKAETTAVHTVTLSARHAETNFLD